MARTWGTPAQRAALKRAQAASAAKRRQAAGRKVPKGGRIAATIGNESMLMRPKQSQAELDKEVIAAGKRAIARRKEYNDRERARAAGVSLRQYRSKSYVGPR